MKAKAQSQATFEYLNVELLDFDPSNPRFGGTMQGKTQADIEKALKAEPYYALELVDSLLKNGYIDYEPLVVKRKGERYIVVEGNRRLAAIKEIHSDTSKYVGRTEDLKTIPALIFPDKPDESQKSEMRIYLGVRHLIGFREWPPLSKAAYLDRLSDEAGGLEEILAELRITKNNAKRFLLPFRLLKAAKVDIPKEEDFWTLGEAMTRSGIKEFLELDVDSSLNVTAFSKPKLIKLLDFVYGKETSPGVRDPDSRVITETRELSRLSRVLESPAAAKLLLDGSALKEAEIYVETKKENEDRLNEVMRELKALLRKLLKGNRSTEAKSLGKAIKGLESSLKAFVKKGRGQ